MASSSNLQTFASLAVVGTFASSEGAARWLEASPSSTLAWMLNAGLFHVFELARIDTLPFCALYGPRALPVAMALIALILMSRLLRSRLGLAMFANASFIGASVLAYAARFSMTLADTQQTAGLILVGLLLTVSFLACVACHWSFALAIREDRRRSPPADPTRLRRFWRTRFRFA